MTDTMMRVLIIVLLATNIASIMLMFFLRQRSKHQSSEIKSQQHYKERLEYVYRILDGIPLPIYIRDAQGVFVYGNKESKNIMGFHEGKLNGKHLEEVMIDASEQWIHTWLDEDQYVIREEKELSLLPQEVISNSGYKFFGVTKKVPVRLDDSGEVYALSVTIDVTDFKIHESKLQTEKENLEMKREESEKRLIAMEKLASLGTVIKAIATSISEPIDTSVALVSTLENEIENVVNINGDDHVDERIKVVFETSKRLAYNLSKTNQLMDRFKLIADESDIDSVKRLKLHELMEKVVESFETIHPSIDIKLVCSEDLMADVNSDGLIQVLTGLVHNAIVHGFETLHEGMVILEAYEYEGRIVIQVKNNGEPIPKEIVDVMYEPLFTSKRDKGFDGLGLSIIFTIVLGVMKGEISHKYESPWTIFEISFPKE